MTPLSPSATACLSILRMCERADCGGLTAWGLWQVTLPRWALRTIRGALQRLGDRGEAWACGRRRRRRARVWRAMVHG